MTRNLVISLGGFFAAIFAVPATAQPVVDLSVEIHGSGSVIGDPPGIDCPSECDASYAKKASVILEATALGGLSFVGWIGDCLGTTPICQLKLNRDKHAIAVFTSYPAPVPKTGTTISFAQDDDGDLQQAHEERLDHADHHDHDQHGHHGPQDRG